MAVAMDKCKARMRVRDARGDDVKATTIKKRKIKRKEKKRKYMSTIYGDVSKPKSNLNLCTNLVGVPALGRVMLNLLRSQSLFTPFSTAILSIKQCPPWALTSSPFPFVSLMLRESQKMQGERK